MTRASHTAELPTDSQLPAPAPTNADDLFEKWDRHRKSGRVPRPRNAFFVFRSEFVLQRGRDAIKDHRDLSRLAGCLWRQMSQSQKKVWFEKADEEKWLHAMLHPDYRFEPGPKRSCRRSYKRKGHPVSDTESSLGDPHGTEQQITSYTAVHQTLTVAGPSLAVLPTHRTGAHHLPPAHSGHYHPYQPADARGHPRSSALSDPVHECPMHTPEGNPLNWEYPPPQGFSQPTVSEKHDSTPVYSHTGYFSTASGISVPDFGINALYDPWGGWMPSVVSPPFGLVPVVTPS